MNEQQHSDFLTALGESFCEYVCPPVPTEYASPHECCEAVWKVVGYNVTPAILASLDDAKICELSVSFGHYFESVAPTTDQIKNAIAKTLFRWPVGSLGESQ